LTVLTDGLSGADQDFLQAAVLDRSRVVSAAAITLLTQLPDSVLRRDMRTLAARHLVIVRRLMRTTVKVSALDIQELAPWPIPDTDPWTALISRIDPAEWPQIFGGDLLALVAGGSAELDPLQPGFRLAAITFRDAGLAQVLLTRKFESVGPKLAPIIDRELWAVLNPADATVQLDRLLAHPLTLPDHVTTAATALATPWSAALARRLARWLPAGGDAVAPALRRPAPKVLWDLWATATALSDCREMADLARSAVTNATGDHSSALTTRASNAANLLTLRAVLYETLPIETRCIPGGNQ
jgi:hypothetical protein